MLVDRWNTLVTGSVDGAVRVWTLQGQYIGKQNDVLYVPHDFEPIKVLCMESLYSRLSNLTINSNLLETLMCFVCNESY